MISNENNVFDMKCVKINFHQDRFNFYYLKKDVSFPWYFIIKATNNFFQLQFILVAAIELLFVNPKRFSFLLYSPLILIHSIGEWTWNILLFPEREQRNERVTDGNVNWLDNGGTWRKGLIGFLFSMFYFLDILKYWWYCPQLLKIKLFKKVKLCTSQSSLLIDFVDWGLK